MSVWYRIFSIFIVLFYPRQITRVICFGRHRDKILVKSKFAYYGIYLFWTIFFGFFCLLMGSACGVDQTFDKVLYFVDLTYGHKEYVEAGASIHMDNLIYLNYYTKEDIDEDLLCQIIRNNKFICEPYKLEEVNVKHIYKETWKIFIDEETLGSIEIKRHFGMWEVCYIWDEFMLERRYENEK